MESSVKGNPLMRPAILLFVVLGVLSVSKSTTLAQDDVQKRQPKPTSSDLKSPLLRGLQQAIQDSEAVGDSGSSGVLVNQLEEADAIWADARQLNRRAFREINRQHRIGIAATSPNILLISIDRLGWRDLGCYGQKVTQTPHMDSLALSGMRFTNYYAGHSDRTAARWCLQNGRNGYDLPRGKSDRFLLTRDNRSIANRLWDSGFLTAYFGLWSNGDRPTGHGYESWSGFVKTAEAMQKFPESIQVNSANVRIIANKNNQKSVSADTMLSSELRSWFEHNRRTRRQFFVHFNASAFADLSDSSKPLTASDYRRRIETADKTVGAVLKALLDARVAKRTMVVLLAKSGPHVSARQAVTKLHSTGPLKLADSQLGEGNLRVPLLVRWPGKTLPGAESDHVCAACDILPTFLETAVSRIKPRTDGISFVPSLTNKKQPPHELLYWEAGHKPIGQAVRKGNWKAVLAPGARSLKLFELKTDPGETSNVAKENPKVLTSLLRR